MAKNFSELRDKMSPERQARVAERTKEMLADMEENKVAQMEDKLTNLIHKGTFGADVCDSDAPIGCRSAARLILQSPDLRVTLVEKPQRYQKHIATNRMCPIVRIVDKELGGYVAEFLGKNADADADAYIQSKEPK